jgi:pantoate kinase
MHRREGDEFVTSRRRGSARAFAPAHVTGVFRPALDARDPRARGSLGAGIVLELGVHAEASFRPGGPRRVRVVGDPPRPLRISEDVAHRLFPARNGTLSVRLRHDLPIGQGFGLSAAGATATALAVGALFGTARRTRLETAHLADLFGGGGLGGVAAIAGGGGLEFRTRPGIPPWGRVVHRPLFGTVLVGVVGGPIASPRVLRDASALARIDRAARDLDDLLHRPSADAFFAASERFTDLASLAPPTLVRVLAALRRRGAYAGQAMFGRTFFARPHTPVARAAIVAWMRAAGVRALELRAAPRGAGSVRTGTASKQPF